VAVTTSHFQEPGGSHDSAGTGLDHFGSAGVQPKNGDCGNAVSSSALPSGELTTDAKDIGHEVDEPRELFFEWDGRWDSGAAVLLPGPRLKNSRRRHRGT